jgi:arylsulfatase A-like enzyme
MQVASVPVSLPSYHSQMAGAVQPCLDNACGRITVETFPEKLKHQLNLLKKEIAIFGSWYSITESAEHIEGSIFTNTGNVPMFDPDTGIPDPEMMEINHKQLADFPEDEYARYDKYTFAQAMHYFQKYKPRFLWIALNDSDEHAHANDLPGYHSALSFYDNVLDQIFTQLQLLQIENETMVIVTTDHGRGNGDKWTDHGPSLPESKQTWAFVMNGRLVPMTESNGVAAYNTLSIRPTVENAMGLTLSHP